MISKYGQAAIRGQTGAGATYQGEGVFIWTLQETGVSDMMCVQFVIHLYVQ